MMKQTGNWIWNPKASGNNIYVDFVRDFKLNEIDSDATLLISADTEYAVFLNGTFIATGQYRDYPDHLSYDTLSIGEYLKAGENRLFIKVYYQGCESLQYSRGDAGVWFRLKNNDAVIEADDTVVSRIAEEYQSGEMFTTTIQLGYGYAYDARKEQAVTDDLKGFSPVELRGAKTFYKRPIKKLVLSQKENNKIIAQGYLKRDVDLDTPAQTMKVDYLSSRYFFEVFSGEKRIPGKISAISNDDLYFVIDFEEERTGYLNFDIDISEGACVDIAYGQHIDDLRVRPDINGRNFANRYISREGRQNFTYYFKRISGRYMQVHISGFSHLTIYDMGIIRTDYPVKHTGKFISCDSLHNKIHDISKETLIACMHDHYEDTPWREQALYPSDSRNQMLFGYYTFSEYDMPRSSLALLARGVPEDGYIPMCAPSDMNICIPSFSFIWFIEMKEYIDYSGDTSLAEELWEKIEWMFGIYTKNIRTQLAWRPRGIRYWHFYEWAEGNYFDDPWMEPQTAEFEAAYLDGLYNAFLCLGLQNAIAMGEKLGKKEFCDKYNKVLSELRAGINLHFWNEEKGVYASAVQDGKQKNYSELMQSVCILAGVSDDKKTQMLRKIMSDDNSFLVKITFSYALYKYEALLAQDDAYMAYVLADIEKQWGKMVYSNAVTMWEMDKESKDFGLAGSLCHGWASVPIYIYYRYALGITPEFMRGETEETKPYQYFPVCRGVVETLKGVKEVKAINPDALQ